MRPLSRGANAISPDGTVMGARLKREEKDGDKIDNWSWTDNPFAGSRELNGLRVMMALLNNWDLTTANNKVYVANDTERRYVVSDLGASFGKTGGSFTRSKGVLKDYRNSPFIERADEGFVDFTMATRPFALKKPFHPAYYKMRVQIEMVAKHIPRADVRWIAQRLSQLTPGQLRRLSRRGLRTKRSRGLRGGHRGAYRHPQNSLDQVKQPALSKRLEQRESKTEALRSR